MCAVLLAGPAAEAATQTEIDQAIQDGLAWLATTQHTSGAFGSGYYLANTATAVLAFENEGNFPGGGNTYSAEVEMGLDYIFTRAQKWPISVQTYGGRNDDPDTNGNGQGVFFSYNSYMYETGLAMQAIVASNTPDRVVAAGQCAGMTYRQVVEDMVDFLAWAQIDGGPGRGGWRYGMYNNASGYGDNSVAQWPVLGLVAAEQWGIHAPLWVKNEMEFWVTYIQNSSSGGSGYDTPTAWVNMAKTGGLLVEFFYLGDDMNTSRAVFARNFLNSRWNVSVNGWYGNKSHPYAMFSVFKGLELMQVATVPNALPNSETPAGDWWGDYAENLVNTQNSSGYWGGYYYWGPYLATPWNIIILQASVFPVSVDVVVPGAACDVTGYEIEVHYGVERFEANGTLTVYRDDVLYHTEPLVDFIGSATLTLNVAPETVGDHTWRAVLDVTGGGIDVQAEDTDDGTVFATPQVAGIPDQVSPFTTFDLDDYQTCDCDDVDWSASGVPAGWTVAIDPDNVVTVTAPDGAVDPAEITFEAVFHWTGIDCDDSDSAIFSPNQPPVPNPGRIYPEEWYEVDEGMTVQLDGTGSYDPEGHDITFLWDLDEDGVFETSGAEPIFSAAGLDNPPIVRVYVHLRVCDEYDACADASARVDILDLPPTAAFAWAPEPQNEGWPVQFTDQSTSVVDTIVSWAWDFASLGTHSAQHPAFTFPDDGLHSVCLEVEDDDGSTDGVCHDVTIINVPPVVGPITVDLSLVEVNSPINAGASFTDDGTADTHTAMWNWGDTSSAGTVTESNGSGSVGDSHTYTEAGVYTVQLTVTDDDGGAAMVAYQYVVVYDPSAGFVTGGGWIDSPEGAYMPDPTLTGKATFGFVSKYKKGASTPTGNTEFQFHAGDLNFHSSDYDWLVVTGGNYARYKGKGTINGAGEYKFLIWAGDGDPDTFRIKIWTEDEFEVETVVYDNGMDQAIGGGNIVVHTK